MLESVMSTSTSMCFNVFTIIERNFPAAWLTPDEIHVSWKGFTWINLVATLINLRSLIDNLDFLWQLKLQRILSTWWTWNRQEIMLDITFFRHKITNFLYFFIFLKAFLGLFFFFCIDFTQFYVKNMIFVGCTSFFYD